jgi:hypothetical protein
LGLGCDSFGKSSLRVKGLPDWRMHRSGKGHGT